ncbi:checkpoint protein rad24 [Spizellomyces punctatus DAOM BR117]|uniref:Checkpoint protein rad24 n=1 Tax=Spizellomyces punctatus (strain DAOM BR117) TaxID=645134 RepID=A0A0L0HJ86_SPIPD|nr:checkpoint protein rad24 [Spizellomyces punctatus DAOM BR117]KND01073.1 checkpoint protein rad24 [Spizellomyces punctatus DAOM BR117]|eukprot:XP_016609112.1 checkpoint protein rad24 [Spizellomyces punctatus DAOM BR117]
MVRRRTRRVVSSDSDATTVDERSELLRQGNATEKDDTLSLRSLRRQRRRAPSEATDAAFADEGTGDRPKTPLLVEEVRKERVVRSRKRESVSKDKTPKLKIKKAIPVEQLRSHETILEEPTTLIDPMEEMSYANTQNLSLEITRESCIPPSTEPSNSSRDATEKDETLHETMPTTTAEFSPVEDKILRRSKRLVTETVKVNCEVKISTDEGSKAVPKRRKLQKDDQAANLQREQTTAPSGLQRWIIPSAPLPERRASSPQQETQLWIDKYHPLSENELAVNNKKVSDVKKWLVDALSTADGLRRSKGQTAKLLVLTGPSGAGKTAVLRTLSKEMNFEILEWSNPINTNMIKLNEDDMHADVDEDRRWQAGYISLTRQFQNFLASASKTPALTFVSSASLNAETIPTHSPSATTRKIILVEDLPNVAHLSTRTALHTAIRAYIRSPRSQFPLVFIVTDTTVVEHGNERRSNGRTDVVSVRTLIPADVSASSAYTQISFNPIAPTYLVKALTRITDLEFRSPMRSSLRPDKESIEVIAKSSGGDIRCAINALQFLTLRISSNSSSAATARKGARAKNRTPKVKNSNLQLDYVGSRETNLALFHSLGKILYNKRDELPSKEASDMNSMLAQSSPEQLPSHLSEHFRPPLANNPEEAFERAHLDSEAFGLFLHENCLSFFVEIEEVQTSSAYFSISDLFAGNWQHQMQLSSYAASVASRGLLFAHTHPVPPQRFRQMHRPEDWAVRRRTLEFKSGIQEAVLDWTKAGCAGGSNNPGMHLTGRYSSSAMCTDVLPFLGIMMRSPQRTIRTSWSGTSGQWQHSRSVVTGPEGYGVSGGHRSQRQSPAIIGSGQWNTAVSSHHRHLLDSLCNYRKGYYHASARAFGEKDVNVDLVDEVEATELPTRSSNASEYSNGIHELPDLSKLDLDEDIVDDW